MTPPPLPVHAETRTAPRRKLRSAAHIRTDGDGTRIYSSVHDISATGCRLGLEFAHRGPFTSTSAVPDEFTLVIPNDRIEIDCRLAWRRGTEIGVIFQSGFRPLRSAGKAKLAEPA